MIIGIPRALFYWKHPLLWENFFKELGYNIQLSPQTNKEIVEKGVKTADSETCFSVKILYGHLLWLDERVDTIFLPRYKKNSLGEYCPKFFGLPDLSKTFLKNKIISPQVDFSKDNLQATLMNTGLKLGKSENIVFEAAKKAQALMHESERQKKEEYLKKISSDKKKIIVLSLPYNLYDDYVNLNIKERLEKLGAEVIFIDQIPEGDINNNTFANRFHWEFGKELIALSHSASREKISGAVEISAFQCGCDAVIKEFVEREFTGQKIPFLYLLIDEHTAEAGLQTRLEAFIDTLSNR